MALQTTKELSREDYEYWIKQDSWTVEEAVYLIHGRRPVDRAEDLRFYRNELEPKYGGIIPFESGFEYEIDYRTTEIGQTYHLLQSSIAADKVETKDGRVRPQAFLKWANTKGIDVPIELHVLLDDTEEETQEQKKSELRDDLSDTVNQKLGVPTRELLKKPGSETRITPFPSAKNLAWQEVRIAFISDQAIKVKARDQLKKFTFDQIGFEDKRSGKPNRLWLLLQVFAAKRGELSWQNLGSTGMSANQVQSNVKRLRQALRKFICIEDDPFQPYKEVKAYQTKFTITADASALLDSDVDDDVPPTDSEEIYETYQEEIDPRR